MEQNSRILNMLHHPVRTFVGLGDEQDIVKRERIVGFALLSFVIIFTILDIFEDLHEGSTPMHVSSEVSVVLLCVVTCVYLWRRVVGVWSSNSAHLRNELDVVRQTAKKWKAESASLAKGLSLAIEKQLDEWGLSIAEKEVSFALIKGLSFKEIATTRQTSEHTVRQQAGTIYR